MMADKQIDKHDAILMGLVMNLQSSGMMQLGKMVNPHTGETHRDLDGARYTVDILEMLKVKVGSNCDPEVQKLLEQAVMNLQMNYMDELKKGDSPEEPEEPEADEKGESAEQ
jgi:hypothetical protein